MYIRLSPRYIPAMRICSLSLTLLLCCSCQQYQETPPPDPQASMFNVASMRIHPIFTQFKDWTGDKKLDGIEALVEFQDQFGDPTKATGRVIFELFEYRRNFPDPRGRRVVNPWIGSLLTADEQREHWDHTSRAYKFQLSYPQIDPARSYVLSATFEHEGGGRFFNRIVLQSTE